MDNNNLDKDSTIKKAFPKYLIIIFSVVVLSLFSILTINFINPNKVKQLISITENINNINNAPKSKDFSSTDYITHFTQNIENLNKISTEVQNIKASKEIEDLKVNLLTCINKNIELYDNIIYFLKNIESDSLLENNSKISKTKSELEKLFITGYKNNLPFKLDYQNNSILSHSFSYINEIIKINRDKNIVFSKKINFNTATDLIYTQMLALNEDLFFIIDLVKNDGRTLAPVLNTVNENIETFKGLKSDLYSLSIPHGSENIFISLQKIFDSYDNYINLMREYLIHEINNTADESYYKNAKKAYNLLNKDLLEYEKLLKKSEE
ncbi:MAG: hypothetical protein ACRDDL_04520 [Sarcina sp.]